MLKIVPGGKLWTVTPSLARLAPPRAARRPKSTGLPDASRTTASRASFSGEKKMLKWLGSGLTRVTTPVNT